MLICVCNKAKTDCDKVCVKGRLFEPESVVSYQGWPNVIKFHHIEALRRKELAELKKGR